MSSTHPGATLTDPQFLAGLDALLAPYYARNASEAEIAELVRRAEAFFLSSQAPPDTQQRAPLDALTSVPPASTAQPPPPPPSSTTSDTTAAPPYPPTFAELAALIASGAPIPGVRDIPDQLAAEGASDSTAPPRRKPWEQPGRPGINAGPDHDEGEAPGPDEGAAQAAEQ